MTPAQCAFLLAIIVMCDVEHLGGTLGGIALLLRLGALFVLCEASIRDARRARGDR